MRSVLLVGWVALIALGLLPATARAETRLHALIIGNNAPFARSGGAGPALEPLEFADDDAAAVYSLLSEVATSLELLALFDPATQRLFPAISRSARIPSLANVRSAVRSLARRLAEDRARGDRSSVIVFFSGHGSLGGAGGAPALALEGAGLDRRFLYDEVLARLEAETIHLLVDACHAEAVVAPRDQEASHGRLSSARATEALLRQTLARFPNVGAILASSVDASSHEWDELGHGIFTHELLSGLRGAADVNGDRALEYSEVVAFMSAANREVADPRARLEVVARPPRVNLREPLVSWNDAKPRRIAWLVGVAGGERVSVVDERGGRILTLHGDADYAPAVALPAGSRLYVERGARTATLYLQPGERRGFSELAFRPGGSRARDALGESIRRGLFAGTFGRGYYEGFVAQAPHLSRVDFDPSLSAGRGRVRVSGAPRLVVAGLMGTTVASDLHVAHGVALGLRPERDAGWMATIEASLDDDPGLVERRVLGELGLLVPVYSHGAFSLWGGGGASAGLAEQRPASAPTRRSVELGLGGVLGASTRVWGPLGLSSEARLRAVSYRKDARWTLGFAPTLGLGAFVDL